MEVEDLGDWSRAVMSGRQRVDTGVVGTVKNLAAHSCAIKSSQHVFKWRGPHPLVG